MALVLRAPAPAHARGGGARLPPVPSALGRVLHPAAAAVHGRRVLGAPTPYIIGWPGTVDEAQAFGLDITRVCGPGHQRRAGAHHQPGAAAARGRRRASWRRRCGCTRTAQGSGRGARHARSWWRRGWRRGRRPHHHVRPVWPAQHHGRHLLLLPLRALAGRPRRVRRRRRALRACPRSRSTARSATSTCAASCSAWRWRSRPGRPPGSPPRQRRRRQLQRCFRARGRWRRCSTARLRLPCLASSRPRLPLLLAAAACRCCCRCRCRRPERRHPAPATAGAATAVGLTEAGGWLAEWPRLLPTTHARPPWVAASRRQAVRGCRPPAQPCQLHAAGGPGAAAGAGGGQPSATAGGVGGAGAPGGAPTGSSAAATAARRRRRRRCCRTLNSPSDAAAGGGLPSGAPGQLRLAWASAHPRLPQATASQAALTWRPHCRAASVRATSSGSSSSSAAASAGTPASLVRAARVAHESPPAATAFGAALLLGWAWPESGRGCRSQRWPVPCRRLGRPGASVGPRPCVATAPASGAPPPARPGWQQVQGRAQCWPLLLPLSSRSLRPWRSRRASGLGRGC